MYRGCAHTPVVTIEVCGHPEPRDPPITHATGMGCLRAAHFAKCAPQCWPPLNGCRLNMREQISTADRPGGVTPVLWSSCLAMLAVGANSTAIMAALPTMRTDLLTAAMCGSTPAGRQATPMRFANTRRNWSRLRRTSFWPLAVRLWRRCYRRPVCVPKIRFCNIGDEDHREQVAM
jgi:hypothetical protein